MIFAQHPIIDVEQKSHKGFKLQIIDFVTVPHNLPNPASFEGKLSIYVFVLRLSALKVDMISRMFHNKLKQQQSCLF